MNLSSTSNHQPGPLIHKNEFSNDNTDTMTPETSENAFGADIQTLKSYE